MENKLSISLKELIFSTCSIMSVSGFEGRGKNALNSLIGEHFDRCETDAVGYADVKLLIVGKINQRLKHLKFSKKFLNLK